MIFDQFKDATKKDQSKKKETFTNRIEFLKTLKDDVQKNISARYYEESYMNKWYLTHRDDTITLSPEYAYPEMFADYCKFPNKMMHLAKDNAALDNNQW